MADDRSETVALVVAFLAGFAYFMVGIAWYAAINELGIGPIILVIVGLFFIGMGIAGLIRRRSSGSVLSLP
ncbi:MAG: hypothetical protein ACLQEQ_00810 [Nitrososphaerales archaeon]